MTEFVVCKEQRIKTFDLWCEFHNVSTEEDP